MIALATAGGEEGVGNSDVLTSTSRAEMPGWTPFEQLIRDARGTADESALSLLLPYIPGQAVTLTLLETRARRHPTYGIRGPAAQRAAAARAWEVVQAAGVLDPDSVPLTEVVFRNSEVPAGTPAACSETPTPKTGTAADEAAVRELLNDIDRKAARATVAREFGQMARRRRKTGDGPKPPPATLAPVAAWRDPATLTPEEQADVAAFVDAALQNGKQPRTAHGREKQLREVMRRAREKFATNWTNEDAFRLEYVRARPDDAGADAGGEISNDAGFLLPASPTNEPRIPVERGERGFTPEFRQAFTRAAVDFLTENPSASHRSICEFAERVTGERLSHKTLVAVTRAAMPLLPASARTQREQYLTRYAHLSRPRSGRDAVVQVQRVLQRVVEMAAADPELEPDRAMEEVNDHFGLRLRSLHHFYTQYWGPAMRQLKRPQILGRRLHACRTWMENELAAQPGIACSVLYRLARERFGAAVPSPNTYHNNWWPELRRGVQATARTDEIMASAGGESGYVEPRIPVEKERGNGPNKRYTDRFRDAFSRAFADYLIAHPEAGKTDMAAFTARVTGQRLGARQMSEFYRAALALVPADIKAARAERAAKFQPMTVERANLAQQVVEWIRERTAADPTITSVRAMDLVNERFEMTLTNVRHFRERYWREATAGLKRVRPAPSPVAAAGEQKVLHNPPAANLSRCETPVDGLSALRTRYADALLRAVETQAASAALDASLLDRVERVLGISTPGGA